MRIRSFVFSLVVAALLSISAESQLRDAKSPAAPDLSKEAFVFDELVTHVVAESDGTCMREQKTAIHILADAGVKNFAVLSFPYTSANETVSFDYVRVRKPDGTIVKTPDYNIQDMPADVTRSAPMYSDIHEKHVAVKGLGVGDTLEYLVRTRVVKPEIPNQFWIGYTFTKDEIVKNERLEISLPRQMRATISSPNLKAETRDEGERRIYSWSNSNLERKEKQKTNLRVHKKNDSDELSVSVTTFSNWEEMGRWYDELQRESIKVTPAIQAKATELTKGLATDDEKIRAIYNYVALRIHYVGLSFGIGRYQPHPAEDVLGNEYGDCKDKHTLLASLLKAAGYEAWPALINSSIKIDKGAPSPAQFDHVITAVPRGDKFIWLDSTPEVSPFGLILPNLRDKDALVIPSSKAPYLAKTPADPPLVSSQTFEVEGKLSDDGTFAGHIEQSYRGDSEVLLRSAFRTVSQVQWKDLMQGISYRNGYAGEVSAVTASAVDDTTQPFHISYEYLRKKYSDWDNHRFTPPLPPFGIESGVDADEIPPDDPLFLGAPGEVVYRSKMRLPEGASIKPPKNVDLIRPYIEYHATQLFENGTLTTVRRLVIKNREVPLSDWDEYRKFRKAVAEDEWQFISMSGLSASSASGSAQNDDTDSAFNEGVNALQNRDVRKAQEAFERVIQKDTSYSGAHFNLALCLAAQGKIDEALSHLRKEEALSPGDARAYAASASLLSLNHRDSEATEEYRKLLKIDPRNVDVALKLSGLLFDQDKFAEAVTELEGAVKTSPDSPSLRFTLISAYMKAGQKEKGVAALREAVEANHASGDTGLMQLNDSAYLLAENNVELELAKQYAEKAVAGLESSSAAHPEDDAVELSLANKISAAWDTLGWVYFQLGDLARAEACIRSSWLLGQKAVVGDHLGQIYERQGKKVQATHTFQLALAAQPALAYSGIKASKDQYGQIRAHYERLAGKPKPLEFHRLPNGEWPITPEEELGRMRTTHIAVPSVPALSAEVSIVFTPAKVSAVRYVSGDVAVNKIADRLQTAKYNVVFPPGSAATIVRRATVLCTKTSGCDIVLHPVETSSTPIFLPN